MYCTKKGEVGVVLFLIVSLLLVCFLVNSVSAKTYSGSGDCSSVVNNDSTLVGNIPCLGIDGLDINQTNITLDCQGYSIIGNGTIGTVGIVRNNSANNITIKNCNIRDFATGINAVSSWVIYNNTISNNTAGLTLSISNSGNLTVNNNSFILNGDGIQFKQIVSDLNSNQYYFNNFFNNTVDMRGCYGGLSDGFVRIYNNTFHGSFILDTNCGSFVYGVFIYNNLFRGNISQNYFSVILPIFILILSQVAMFMYKKFKFIFLLFMLSYFFINLNTLLNSSVSHPLYQKRELVKSSVNSI